MNKVGIYYAFWEKNWSADFAFHAKKVAKLGFDILELPTVTLLDMPKSEIETLKALRKELGIEYTFSMGLPKEFDISSGNDNVRKSGIKYIKQVLAAIKDLDGKIMGGLTYGAWNVPIEDSKEAHRDRSLSSLKEIIPVAEDYGISYCVEVVNRFEQFIMNDHREAIEYVKEISSPALKIELDTFHMNIEEDSMYEAIVKTGDLIGHFHVGENNRKPPGTGCLPWEMIFSALKKINYAGRIVMEPFVITGGEVGRDISLWREVMPKSNLDQEARKALEFIRKNMEVI